MKKIVVVITVLLAYTGMCEWRALAGSPDSGDMVDIHDQKYVVFRLPDYESLTNKMNVLLSIARRQLADLNKTEYGRRVMHGEKVGATVSSDDLGHYVVTTEYADGYKFVEEFSFPAQKKDASKNDVVVPKRKREAIKNVSVIKEVW